MQSSLDAVREGFDPPQAEELNQTFIQNIIKYKSPAYAELF